MRFGESIASLVNTVLLIVVYVVGVGITAFIGKLLSKKYFKKQNNQKTYWEDVPKSGSYYRQF